MNTIFRFIECVIFFGAAAILMTETKLDNGHCIDCDRRRVCLPAVLRTEKCTAETVNSIMLVSLSPASRKVFSFYGRASTHIDISYDSITIQTAENKKLYFPLRQNLQFDELDQIHEFCRHYLKT